MMSSPTALSALERAQHAEITWMERHIDGAACDLRTDRIGLESSRDYSEARDPGFADLPT